MVLHLFQGGIQFSPAADKLLLCKAQKCCATPMFLPLRGTVPDEQDVFLGTFYNVTLPQYKWKLLHIQPNHKQFEKIGTENLTLVGEVVASLHGVCTAHFVATNGLSSTCAYYQPSQQLCNLKCWPGNHCSTILCQKGLCKQLMNN